MHLPAYGESIPLPFFDPYPQALLAGSCCASPPCWPTWAWGKTLRLSDPASESPERSDSSAPGENTSCKLRKLRGATGWNRTYSKCGSMPSGRSMTVYSQQAFSHSKRADKAGGPDPTKLNIYTLTCVYGPVQGAINKSELLWNGEIVERLRKQMMASVHGEVLLCELHRIHICVGFYHIAGLQIPDSCLPPPTRSGFWELHLMNEWRNFKLLWLWEWSWFYVQ